MEKILQQLLDGQKQLFDGQQQLFVGQQQLSDRLDSIEITLKENVQITMALKNWHEEINAQVHGLAHNLNTLTGTVNKLEARAEKLDDQLNRMADDVGYLVRKSSEHEKDIRQLSRAK